MSQPNKNKRREIRRRRQFWIQDDMMKEPYAADELPSKAKQRAEVAADVERFLASGGKIKQVGIGVSGRPMKARSLASVGFDIAKMRLLYAD